MDGPVTRVAELGLLQEFLARFRPVTTISVEAGDVVFQRGTKVARAQPLIRFAEDGRVIELGQAAATARGGRLVRLFGTDGRTDAEVIRAFCRYHLMLTAGASLLRPRVIIDERSFREAFGRHTGSALQGALRADGFQANVGAVAVT